MPQTLLQRPDSATPEGRARPRVSAGLDVLGGSAPAVALVAFLALAIAADLQLTSALRSLVALLLTQVLPGALVWRLVRPRNGSWLEDLAMGFAIGSTIAIGAQTAAGFSQMPWLSAAIPLALATLMVGVPAFRRRILEAKTSRLPWWFGPAISLPTIAAVPQLLSYFRQVPMNWTSGYQRPHVDAYLHLALSGELAHRGPVNFPWVASEPLAYHWFSHAWVANLSTVSGVELDETLFRFMPAVLPVVVALVVATAAVRLTGNAWSGPVAAALALVGGDISVFGLSATRSALAPLSPSLGLSVPMLVAIVVVLACRWRSQARSGAILLIPLLGIAAAGTKGSTLPLVVAGLGTAVAAAMLFDRSRLRYLMAELAVIIGCLGFAIVMIFHGSEAGLKFDPRHAPEAMGMFRRLGGVSAVDSRIDLLFVDLVVLLGVLARGAGLLVPLATRRGRRDPLTWLLTGGCLAAAGALAVFTHPGNSQAYFAYSAIPLLALGSAVGLASIFDILGAGARRPVLIGLVGGLIMVLLPPRLLGVLSPAGGVTQATKLIALAGAVLVGVGLLAASKSRRRWAGAGAALVVAVVAAGVTTAGVDLSKSRRVAEQPRVAAKTPLATSPEQIEAARWIRDNSVVDDMVMTNRHCVSPTPPERGCDSRRWLVAAFSERQVLLEGWTATPRSTDLAPVGRESITIKYWKPDLLDLNDGFIAKPDAAAAAKLSAMGVRWVYVDFTRPHAQTLEPFAHMRFHTAAADVYELPRTG